MKLSVIRKDTDFT